MHPEPFVEFLLKKALHEAKLLVSKCFHHIIERDNSLAVARIVTRRIHTNMESGLTRGGVASTAAPGPSALMLELTVVPIRARLVEGPLSTHLELPRRRL